MHEGGVAPVLRTAGVVLEEDLGQQWGEVLSREGALWGLLELDALLGDGDGDGGWGRGGVRSGGTSAGGGIR